MNDVEVERMLKMDDALYEAIDFAECLARFAMVEDNELADMAKVRLLSARYLGNLLEHLVSKGSK